MDTISNLEAGDEINRATQVRQSTQIRTLPGRGRKRQEHIQQSPHRIIPLTSQSTGRKRGKLRFRGILLCPLHGCT
jgi:hypothetical protein